jgi:hypothetical protein
MKFDDFKEGTRCWKGYKKKGMKTMFGKRVPNCVKNEAEAQCKEGEYFCNTDQKCKPIPDGHTVDNDGILVKEDLRAWFGKGKKGGAGGGGWDRYNSKGERIGKCGDSKPGEGKPKCLSKSKAASLRSSGGKKAISNAVKRKRKNDPNPDRRGKAKNVKNKVKDSIEEYGVGIVTKQNATKDVPVGGEYMNVKKLSLDKKPKKKTKKLKANYNRNELPQIKNKQLENIKHTLETVNVKKLIPVQEERIVENFKKQVDNIVAGEYNPIIVDSKNRIVNGHHRYTALQMLGIKEADVARLPYTLEQILEVFEAHHFKNPKNTFLTKADTAYDFLRVGKTISNLSNAKKSDNRDEPDVMVVPFGGEKEKKHLKKGLKKAGYKTQDAGSKGDDAHVDEDAHSGDIKKVKFDADLKLPNGKNIVLQADDDEYTRGLVIRSNADGSYDSYYWYNDPKKKYPIEVQVDGKSVSKDAKNVHWKYHPELKENSPVGMSKDTAVALGNMSKDTSKAIDKYQQTNTTGKTSRAFTDIEDEYLDIRLLAMKLIKNGLDPYVAYYKASEKMQFDPAMVFDWMGSEYKDEELEDFIPVEYERDWIKRAELVMTENFADGKKKGKSRPGRVKKSGASCKGSVTDLRKRAKGASGEKRKMYHWCANMKSGRSKK